MVALIALAAALATAGAPEAAGARCPPWATRGIVAGHTVCLEAGARCRARYQERYRRYGFRCISGLLDYDWAALHRPVQMPSVLPGTPCPASTPHGTLGEKGNVDMRAAPAFGPGPAYPFGLSATDGRAVLKLTWSPSDPGPYHGWSGTKVLWTIPRYYGAVLVRGQRLDSAGEVGFDVGPQWTWSVLPELRLVGAQWNLHPAATFVRERGCYAYQVDTRRASYVIVFEVS